MYHKIYDFCKIKNVGNCFKNGVNPTPRVNFILDLCKNMGIEYELDVWAKDYKKIDYSIIDVPDFEDYGLYLDPFRLQKSEDLYIEYVKDARDFLLSVGIDEHPEYLEASDMDMLGDEFANIVDEYTDKLKKILGEISDSPNNFFNIVIKGKSDKFVVAHHDIVNPLSDNANDNSASVINALMIKKNRPEVNVVILDGEELGGLGAKRLSERIKNGEFKCKWILNLELTGIGGKNFFVGDMGTNLTTWIANRFECPIVKVPFNDSVIFTRFGIDSTVINPLPICEKETRIVTKDGDYLDQSVLFRCHKMEDSVDKIKVIEMKEFVEDICLKIIDEA